MFIAGLFFSGYSLADEQSNTSEKLSTQSEASGSDAVQEYVESLYETVAAFINPGDIRA